MGSARAGPGAPAPGGPARDLHDEAARRLAAQDQRYTRCRRSLVEALDAAESPLSIPRLLDHDRSLAQSSAYRNLAVLERAGLVHRIVTADDWARYELDHALTHHHHHLICASCGVVRDFTVSARLERSIDTALAKVAGDAGFHLDHHRLDLVGYCGDCA